MRRQSAGPTTAPSQSNRTDRTDTVGEVGRIGATATGVPGVIPWLFSGAQEATGEVAPIFEHIHSKGHNLQTVDIRETCIRLPRSRLGVALLLVSATCATSDNASYVTHGVNTGALDRHCARMPQYEAMQRSCCAAQALCGVERFIGHVERCALNRRILLANPQVPKFVCPTCLL
jgi:hypothetical protein